MFTATGPDWPVGIQEYVNGPVPPLALTVADPRLPQVMEKVLNDSVGAGLRYKDPVAVAEHPCAVKPVTV